MDRAMLPLTFCKNTTCCNWWIRALIFAMVMPWCSQESREGCKPPACRWLIWSPSMAVTPKPGNRVPSTA